MIARYRASDKPEFVSFPFQKTIIPRFPVFGIVHNRRTTRWGGPQSLIPIIIFTIQSRIFSCIKIFAERPSEQIRHSAIRKLRAYHVTRSSTTTANRRVAVTILTLLAFVQHGVAFNSRLTRWRVRRRSAPPRKSTSDFRLRPKQQPPVLDPSATADAADAADAAAATFAASPTHPTRTTLRGPATPPRKKLGPVDVKRLGTYLMATALETAGICALLFGADAALAFILAAGLRTTLAWLLFAFLSLRSRVFSVLDNSRPNREAQGGAATPKEVKRPPGRPRATSSRSVIVCSTVSSTAHRVDDGSIDRSFAMDGWMDGWMDGCSHAERLRLQHSSTD